MENTQKQECAFDVSKVEEKLKNGKTLSDLTGPNGVSQEMFTSTIERILKAEQELHLGYEPYKKEDLASENSRNSYSKKTLRMSSGVLTPDSRHKMISGLAELIENSEAKLSPLIREVLLALREELKAVMSRIEEIEKKIHRLFGQNEVCQLLETIPGVGLLTATAVFAAVPDPNQFRNGRHFSASIGLVPRQHSTGGKSTLLGISKRGDRYLRKLIVHGRENPSGDAPAAVTLAYRG